MDALTEALNGIRLRSTLHCPSELSGQWGICVQKKGGAPFYILLHGSGWLEVEGEEPVRLEAGDFVILPQDSPHTLRDAPDSPAQPLMGLLEQYPPGEDGIWRFGGGGETTVAIGGCFFFEEAQTSPLLNALPPLLHVRGEQGQVVAWLEPTLKFIASEARSGRPGAQAIITRLSDILFIQAVRAYVCRLPEGETNWLRAMGDPQIGRALTLIHQKPEHLWKVETLAAEVAMSRSAFAARFTAVVGEPPLQYVTRWRVHQAARLLREDFWSVAEVAVQVGYQSEAAFSRVFKQWTGQAPAAYRRRERHHVKPSRDFRSTL
ncbi:MAG TPA: AraC family transcriptional regulator [Chthonomonadaceae bacterium]|nr:AraC family transcriptional regulator [Chthonomonadaceae bacterium]